MVYVSKSEIESCIYILNGLSSKSDEKGRIYKESLIISFNIVVDE